MKLLTYTFAAIGLVFVIFGMITDVGNSYLPILIGLIGTIFLFAAFILWIFKVKK